jgi:predicted ATPase
VTGPGGCGKTRLAIEVGKRLIGDFADGVHLVPLASVNDPHLVLPTVAKSVGLQESATESPLEGLANFLRTKQMLLILDNFEQLVDAALQIAELLGEAPALEVLVTSRASLNLQAEQEFPLEPLGLPRAGDSRAVQTLHDSEAIRLFEERARAAKPDFAITPENAGDVAEIVRRLDGLPLAIELAAVRVRLLSPAALLQRLSSRLRLLTSGPRDLPARQQTLRNAIDWDYELLEPPEQALFRRLAVFVHAFDLDAATEVVHAAGDPGIDPLDGIESLLGKSLLRQIHARDGQPLFGMLQTIREYAQEMLVESGEEIATRDRHAQVCLEVAIRGSEELRGPNQIEWLERLDQEHDGLRAALEWASRRDERDLELNLVAALMSFWPIRGHLSEARKWSERALSMSHGDRTKQRAEILYGAAILARARLDYDIARSFLEECLAIQEELGLTRGVAESVKGLGNLQADQNHFDAAREFYEKSLALWRELGDDQGMSETLNNLGYLARERGEPTRAVEMLSESLDLFRDMGDKQGTARALMNLSAAVRDLGRIDEAKDLAQESLELWRDLGDTWDVADCIDELALVAVEIEEWERAARLFGASDALRRALGARRPPLEQALCMKGIEAVRSRLGRNAFTAAWGEGSRMRMEEAIDHALDVGGDVDANVQTA